ncbi:hypothetical protein EYD10_02591 [Varanus komodoensis]|nr:hypothetical protein EYD10_02591 [Varanus komodoensis]
MVKKRKGRVLIDSDTEDSGSEENLDQELLSLAKRKRGDSEEKEAPASKPTASSDSETSDSDVEVSSRTNIDGIKEATVNYYLTNSLPELMEIVSDLVFKTPRMLVLGDFNLHAEMVLTGAAQDFMASMAAMGLSQHVTGPTHERGHALDLVLLTGQEEGDRRVRNLCLTPLSWSDHFLVRFELESGLFLCKGAYPIVLVRPWSRLDPDGFLKALGDFPVDKAGAPVDALVEL